MKKTIIKIVVLLLVFVATLCTASKIMNKDHDNITMEMAQATFPLVSLQRGEVTYNTLHGFAGPQQIAYMQDNLTVLGENRETDFLINTFGQRITKVMFEVRNMDGSRLIEQTEVKDCIRFENEMEGKIAIKDLLEADTLYSLAFVLTLEDERQVYYYTRVIWNDGMDIDAKMAFVLNFHDSLFDKEAATDITKYLETNAALNSNKTFAYVDIYSNFQQITYGDLEPVQVGDTRVQLTDSNGSLASFVLDFEVTTGSGKNKVQYWVEEYYRIRYTESRVYLLDYERRMQQVPRLDQMCTNDKIVLGITDENVEYVESEDGTVVAFLDAGQLLCYQSATNKLARVFSFYNDDTYDERTIWQEYGIKILDVDEAGNVAFVVYGYMNRGRHEGEVGIEVYFYDSSLNTIEELCYIPYGKSSEILMAEINDLLYLNRNNHLYFMLEDMVFCVDLQARTYEQVFTFIQDDSLQTSANHRILITSDADEKSGLSSKLTMVNLNRESGITISVAANEAIRSLGFIGEDLIYGIAKKSDIYEESTGQLFFPMYKICICDEEGNLLKEYSQDGFYVTECVIAENQITLERVTITENGKHKEALPDHITTSSEETKRKIVVAATDIDVYKRYVQLQVLNDIQKKNLKIVTPKEMVYEGGRILDVTAENIQRYYVYDAYGVAAIYNDPANAVNEAASLAGRVLNDCGCVIWKKVIRQSRNQIMAITEEAVTEDKDSLAVCLDTMLKYEGIVRNSDYLLSQGDTVLDILSENLENKQVLNLTGCSLDSVLYYVNQDIPVLAMLQDGTAVLITGFNEFNIVVMDPTGGKLYKKGLGDSKEWLEENGNIFITYSPLAQ